MSTALELRNQLLEDGPEIIKAVHDIAKYGEEACEYVGNLSTLKMVYKTIAPLITIDDDPIPLTSEDRNASVDEAIEFYRQGRITQSQALEHAKLIGLAQDVTDVRTAMVKLDAMLENSNGQHVSIEFNS